MGGFIRRIAVPRFAIAMFLVLMLTYLPVFAQDDDEENGDIVTNEANAEIMKGVLGPFSLPLRDLMEEEESDSALDALFKGFSGDFAWSWPMQEEELPDGTGARKRDITLNATVRYNPVSYWYFNTTFYHHLDSRFKNDWEPDFTYSFGYDDWHPDTLSLVYYNFSANRFHPDRDKGERFTRLEEGVIKLGWKFAVPREFEEPFIVHSSGGIRGSLNYNLVPRYADDASGDMKHWKQWANLNIKYTIYEWLYFSMDFNWYPRHSQQQPWDPDFSYGFGSFNWQPGALNLQFSNGTNNTPGAGILDRFKDGSITGSWSWAW